MTKIQSSEQWVKILNEALKALRELVDDDGNGVFRLNDVFEPLGYKPQTHTISKHLQNLRLLFAVQKQPDGKYLWRVDMKKRVTLKDVQKSREREASRRRSHALSTPKKPVTKSKPTPESTPKPVGKPKPSSTSSLTPPTAQQLRLDDRIVSLLSIIDELEAKLHHVEVVKKELERENSSLKDQLESINNPDLDRRVNDVLTRYRGSN